MRGYGYDPYVVEGDDPAVMHQLMATALDSVIERDRTTSSARRARAVSRSGRAGR